MIFDASPCGWSGLLVQDGALACIADRVTLDGATLLNVEHGSARSQQCVEVLERLSTSASGASVGWTNASLFSSGPSVMVHVLGCTNIAGDILSRVEEPGMAPACLQAAQRAVPLVRDAAYFRTLLF